MFLSNSDLIISISLSSCLFLSVSLEICPLFSFPAMLMTLTRSLLKSANPRFAAIKLLLECSIDAIVDVLELSCLSIEKVWMICAKEVFKASVTDSLNLSYYFFMDEDLD